MTAIENGKTTLNLNTKVYIGNINYYLINYIKQIISYIRRLNNCQPKYFDTRR